MTRAKIIAMLGAGAIAATAIVYFTWLQPDESPLFSVDAPEGREARPPAGPKPPQPDRGEKPRERRIRRVPAPAFAPAVAETAREFLEFAPPPRPPSGAGEPTDDQYGDSLTRLLSRLRAG